MEIKSHIILGEYLLNNISYVSSSHRNMFILGCITPDINMFTYLRGSFKYQKLRGHNYSSSRNYIEKEFTKLRSRRNWNLTDSYRLGKVIHYLADSFTHPHNDSFKGTLAQHRLYESQLHAYLKKYLEQYCETDNSDCSADVSAGIDELRKKYEKTQGEIPCDARSVTQAASQIMMSMKSACFGKGNLSSDTSSLSETAFPKLPAQYSSYSVSALRRRILSLKVFLHSGNSVQTSSPGKRT